MISLFLILVFLVRVGGSGDDGVLIGDSSVAIRCTVSVGIVPPVGEEANSCDADRSANCCSDDANCGD